MYIPLIFLILISSFNYISLSADQYKCRQSDINREIEIGDEVTICLHSKEKKQKIAYKLKVDKYSIITIKGGFEAFQPESTNPEQNPSPSEDTTKYRFRNMIKEGNNDEEKILAENQNPNLEETTNPTIELETTQVTDEQKEEQNETDIIEENPDDKRKFFAQIGDKMTQYPSVSIFNIYIYINIFFDIGFYLYSYIGEEI